MAKKVRRTASRSKQVQVAYVDPVSGEVKALKLGEDAMEQRVHLMARAVMVGYLYHKYQLPTTTYPEQWVLTKSVKAGHTTAPYTVNWFGDPADAYKGLKAAELKALIRDRGLDENVNLSKLKMGEARLLLQAADRVAFKEEMTEAGIIVAEVNGDHSLSVSGEGANRPAACNVPECHGSVFLSRCNAAAVRAEGYGIYAFGMVFQYTDFSPALCVPQPHGAVPTARDNARAVVVEVK